MIITIFRIFAFLAAFVPIYMVKSISEWKSRVVYQVITDRFYKGEGNYSSCKNLFNRCGGTLQGITEKLDYIQNLGIEAIWISPLCKNRYEDYHGYGCINLYRIDENMGDEETLNNLVEEMHKRNIFLIHDIVFNHVGRVMNNFYKLYPFNKPEFFHPFSPLPLNMWQNRQQMENAWIYRLPDLDQDHPMVKKILSDWLTEFVIKKFRADALRIDTVPFVPHRFWREIQEKYTIFTIGEVLNGDVNIISEYMPHFDSLFNYPLYYTLVDVFARSHSMKEIRSRIIEVRKKIPDPSVLGIFIDNHDVPRFLNINPDITLFKNSLVYVLFAEGIPFIYYGSEQGFSGGKDPLNRETMWHSFNSESDLYKFIQLSISIRKEYQIWSHPHIEIYVDNDAYIFKRGKVIICTTNNKFFVSKKINIKGFSQNTPLCNVFDTNDCIFISEDSFYLSMENGYPKVYAPLFYSDRDEESSIPEFFSNLYLNFVYTILFAILLSYILRVMQNGNNEKKC